MRSRHSFSSDLSDRNDCVRVGRVRSCVDALELSLPCRQIIQLIVDCISAVGRLDAGSNGFSDDFQPTKAKVLVKSLIGFMKTN